MKDLYVKLRSLQDVHTLANLATACRFPVTVTDGQHRVDAKSLMCFFILHLDQPLLLQLDCSDEEFERFRIYAAAFEM